MQLLHDINVKFSLQVSLHQTSDYVQSNLDVSKLMGLFLAHLAQSAKVSFCDTGWSVIRRACVRLSVRACVRQQFV